MQEIQFFHRFLGSESDFGQRKEKLTKTKILSLSDTIVLTFNYLYSSEKKEKIPNSSMSVSFKLILKVQKLKTL